MSKQLAGKICLVTGASSGIGRATAVRLAGEGGTVVLGSRRMTEGEATVRTIREAGGVASFVQTDVQVEDQIRKLVDHAVSQHGRLDIAFNNAGIEGEMGLLHERSTEEYQAIFDVNVRGVFLCMKYEIQQMLAQGGCGSIVNTSSTAGVVGSAQIALYAASKHAVMGLTRSAALEYAKEGIRINAVNPAGIRTEMLQRFAGDDGQQWERLNRMHPVGRIGQPEEVADAVLWLVSEQASFVHGHALLVDGGFTAR